VHKPSRGSARPHNPGLGYNDRDRDRDRDLASLLLLSRESELPRRGLLERLRRFSGSGERRGDRDRDFMSAISVVCGCVEDAERSEESR
jgi:hypothetical protein